MRIFYTFYDKYGIQVHTHVTNFTSIEHICKEEEKCQAQAIVIKKNAITEYDNFYLKNYKSIERNVFM